MYLIYHDVNTNAIIFVHSSNIFNFHKYHVYTVLYIQKQLIIQIIVAT
jgi:hypothetical protein